MAAIPLRKIENLPGKHVLETQQYSLAGLEKLFCLADQLGKNPVPRLAGKTMCSLFYEPSTRTRFSFESAMLKLGGNYIGSDKAGEFSSAAKGESLEDTIQVVAHYADVVVLRHHESNAAKRAAAISKVPIINAGCGTGQHPTQALLDIYTIRRVRGNINGLRIALMGDLKHGRTVRSLAYLAGKYPGVELYFASPEELRLENDMRTHFREHGIKFHEFSSIDDIIDLIDVLYVTRLQTERMHPDDQIKLNGSYRLHRGMAQQMKEGSIIMHPLPRVGEVSTDVDTLPGAVYLNKQVECGLWLRMALLADLLS